ncbi:MAG: glycosyltransferase family 4 protein, partial [Bacteroidales bacterium]|nr:glycosyltransferase family 4 protein [Bacteroidales bacterium]
HPTFNDCLPLVLLEAMQHSLPVVSTPEGAIPDVVEDGVNGFLVPQKNATALADKLEVLIKDPDLRHKMGSAGRARYEAQFTLERFERRIVEILNQVAEKKTGVNG